MMDMTSNTFARRVRLSTSSIALALAVTMAAVLAVLYSSGGRHEMAQTKVQVPVSDTATH